MYYFRFFSLKKPTIPKGIKLAISWNNVISID